MKHTSITAILILFLLGPGVAAQDTLKVKIQNQIPKETRYTQQTFKGTRIVIGQSIENPAHGSLVLMITHHFGLINGGYQNLFGLNQAFLRLGLEYGVTRWLGLGVGVNTYQLTWDGFAKFKILSQSTGERKMPLSLSFFVSTAINTAKWSDPERSNYFSSRISYAFSLMIARKFGRWFSLQLMPEMVHKNLVATREDHNDIFGIGAGARIRASDRVSFNAEYHYVFPDQVKSITVYNSFSIGVDIETSGHLFQIFLTNSTGETEEYFIPETTNKWLNGGIFLGFNISRIFEVYRPGH